MTFDLSDALVGLGAASALLAALYYLRVRWWSSLPGIADWTMTSVVALVMVLAFVRSVLDVELPEWVRAAIYLLILLGIWTKLAIMVYVNRTGRTSVSDERQKVGPDGRVPN